MQPQFKATSKAKFTVLGILASLPVLASAAPAKPRHAPKTHKAGQTDKFRPVIASIAPNSYRTLMPDVSGQPAPKFVTLLISGQNFGPKSVALWNGKGLATHFLSSDKIEATVPFLWIVQLANQVSLPDKLEASTPITVRSAGVGSAQSNAVNFTAEVTIVGG